MYLISTKVTYFIQVQVMYVVFTLRADEFIHETFIDAHLQSLVAPLDIELFN